jgi:hypothetical protein
MANRLEPTMNRTFLLLALAAAVPARAANEFKPIKPTESVTYPLPPMPLPAVQPTDGKWAETEDSPALRVSRAWVKLGQAAGVERSEATRRLYQSWKNEVARKPRTRASSPPTRKTSTRRARSTKASSATSTRSMPTAPRLPARPRATAPAEASRARPRIRSAWRSATSG